MKLPHNLKVGDIVCFHWELSPDLYGTVFKIEESNVIIHWSEKWGEEVWAISAIHFAFKHKSLTKVNDVD